MRTLTHAIRPASAPLLMLLSMLSMLTLSGCAATVLQNAAGYEQEVSDLRGRITDAQQQIAAAATTGNEAQFLRARSEILTACGRIDRISGYAEAAVRSYYGQQNSRAGIAAAEKAAYEHTCIIDGEQRLPLERSELEAMDKILIRGCGCSRTAGPGSAVGPFSECSMSEAAWDEFQNSESEFLGYVGVQFVGLLFAPVAWVPALGQVAGTELDAIQRRDYCESVHRRYRGQYNKVEQLAQFCASPPRAAPYDAPATAEDLDQAITAALDHARAGAGSDVDGSQLYEAAYSASQDCETLVTRLGDGLSTEEPSLASSILDTTYDQEPATLGDYTIPEDPEPPAPESPR